MSSGSSLSMWVSARSLASEILWLSSEDVASVFYAETKRRKLGRVVRFLDDLATQKGADGRFAATALERLGFR